jgi:CheY-like chemotaxis protein
VAQEVVGYKGRSRRLLIVDDEAQNRAVLISLLQPLGFEIDEASDGSRCLEQMHRRRPDLVLMDLVMPVMSGFEAARRIRQQDALKDIVIVAVSASVLDVNQHESFQVGCNEFLSKPIQMDVLLEMLEKHLNLEWIYDDAGDSEQEEGIAADGNAIPSRAELDKLYEYALMGDLITIKAYAIELEQNRPPQRAFARQLQQLAGSFEDEQVIHLLENCRASVAKQEVTTSDKL